MRVLKSWAPVVAIALTIAALAVVAGSVHAQGQVGAVVAFEGGRLIVGDGSAPIENATFVVTNGRFTQVGRTGQVRVPAGATHINIAGKTVMPAIIDTHTHLSQTRPELTNDLERRAYYGIAAALSLGQDIGEAPYEIRNENLPNAAQFRTAGRGITMPEPGRTMAPIWVTTDAEARKAVQDNAAKKVTLIKIWVDDRNGTVKKLTPDLYRSIIDEAHKNKLRVEAHIFALDDAKDLVRAGIDAFAHSVRDKDMDEEAVRLYRQKAGLVVCPNLPDRGVPADMSWLSDSIPADELKKIQTAASQNRPDAQQAYGIQARNLAKLSAAGVKIVLGTDGNTPYAPHVEMEDMVAAGMTPAQVIVAATKNGAEFLQMTDLGTVANGKSADFIILDANPLDDIKNTRKINSVYLRGAAVDRAGLRAKWMGRSSQ
jgi:imidazolonepropionase-like amidohydrolase